MDIYKILNKVQTKVSGSKEVDPKTMNQMRKMAEEIAGGRKRRILKQVAAAAIVLCIGGGVTVGAAGGFKDSILHKFLYFGEGTESAETSFSRMNQEDVLAGAKDKGIGVEVKQSISVKGMMYVLLKVELPEGEKFRKDQDFQYIRVQTGAKTDPKAKEETHNGTDTIRLVEQKDNMGWFIIRAEREAYEFDQKKIKLSLYGFSDTHTTPANLIFENPKGTWNLEWTHKADDKDAKVVSYEKKEIPAIEQGKCPVRKLEITSFYLKVYVGEKNSGKVPQEPKECSLKMKDGTVIEQSWWCSDEAAKGYAYLMSVFENSVDVKQVQSVIVDGIELPVQ